MSLIHVPRTPCRASSSQRNAVTPGCSAPALVLAGLLAIAIPSPHAVAQPSSSAPTATAPADQGKAKAQQTNPDGSSNAIADAAAMALFLDRLMIAESGGRDDARNPRSTAVGPFQFIESTFLNVVRRHFAAETGELSTAEILKLRTNRTFARRAAEAFTRDNAALLAIAGAEPTFANLRLAHLVGPGGAVRILKAPADTPAVALLGGHVGRANPFLVRMTTADLVRWAARNLASPAVSTAKVAADPKRVAGSGGEAAKPAIRVRCNRALASCRRWIALATSRIARKERVAGVGTKQRRR